MNRETRLFFDASVLVSAVYSTTGGSSRLLRLCELGELTPLTSILVLNEVERTLRESFPAEMVQRLQDIVRTVSWTVIDVPSEQLLTDCTALIHRDDAHVLAAALMGRADFLLTLDRKHFFTAELQTANLGLVIVTPGQFIQAYLPQHVNYPLSS